MFDQVNYWWLHIFSLTASLFHGVITQGAPEIKPGPSSGILIKNNPGLLLADRKIITQTIFVNLDPERMLRKWSHELQGKSTDEQDRWYLNHLARTRESVKEALRQIQKTYIVKNTTPVRRDKRFIGLIIGLVVTTVAAAVIGSTMSVANAITIDSVNKKTEQLKESLNLIQEQVKQQESVTEQVIQIINETVLMQNTHSEMLDRSINLHEKAYRERSGFYAFVEPIWYMTQEFLRETQASIDSLIQGRIPLYMVPVDTVRQILKQIHHKELSDTQLSIAYEMGCTLTIFLDVDLMQLAFIMNLPLVIPENIYQLKSVVNVGTWKGDTYVKVKAPEVLAYQEWNQGVYLVPNLDNCLVFKDLNFLCPGKPFVPQTAVNLCGVADPMEETVACDLVISKPDTTLFNTVVTLVDKKWLVSTVLENLTISYTAHGTFKVVPIKNRVSLISVPRDAIVTIGGHILFHISGEAMSNNLELINIIDQEMVPINEDLEFLLKHKVNHTIRVSINKRNVTLNTSTWSKADRNMVQEHNWELIKVWVIMGFILLMVIWLLTLTIVGYKVFKTKKEGATLYTPMRKIQVVPLTKIIEVEDVQESCPS